MPTPLSEFVNSRGERSGSSTKRQPHHPGSADARPLSRQEIAKGSRVTKSDLSKLQPKRDVGLGQRQPMGAGSMGPPPRPASSFVQVTEHRRGGLNDDSEYDETSTISAFQAEDSQVESQGTPYAQYAQGGIHGHGRSPNYADENDQDVGRTGQFPSQHMHGLPGAFQPLNQQGNGFGKFFDGDRSYPSTTSGWPDGPGNGGVEHQPDEENGEEDHDQVPDQKTQTLRPRQADSSSQKQQPPQTSVAMNNLAVRGNAPTNGTSKSPVAQVNGKGAYAPVPSVETVETPHEPKHEDVEPEDDPLDFDELKLQTMNYSELRNQSFDDEPNPPELPASQIDDRAPLTDRLSQAFNLPAEEQSNFFSRLNLSEWEEAGDWFLEQFGSLVNKMKDARREKRKQTADFEEEIYQRHRKIQKRSAGLQEGLGKMKASGGQLLREGTPSRTPRRR